MPQVGAGQRGDRIDHQQRRMIRAVHRRAHRRDVGHAACRGLAVHDADRLDAVLAVVAQHRADRVRVGAAAPVGVQEHRIQPVRRRQLLPQMGEPAGAGHQHAVAGRQRVDHRRFPRAGAGGREDRHDSLGLEHVAQLADDLAAELAELRTSVIDRRCGPSARSTRSGTLVGPGVCRKCRPATVMGIDAFLPAAGEKARRRRVANGPRGGVRKAARRGPEPGNGRAVRAPARAAVRAPAPLDRKVTRALSSPSRPDRRAAAPSRRGAIKLDRRRGSVHLAHFPIDRVGDLLRRQSKPLLLRVAAAGLAIGILEEIAHRQAQHTRLFCVKKSL